MVYEREQENAVKGLVELIALFDKDTYFFVNSWTWGYEDVLKGIARAFQCQVGKHPFLRLPTICYGQSFCSFRKSLQLVFNGSRLAMAHICAYMLLALSFLLCSVLPHMSPAVSSLPLHVGFCFIDISTFPDSCRSIQICGLHAYIGPLSSYAGHSRCNKHSLPCLRTV